jgi:Transposase DDE domain
MNQEMKRYARKVKGKRTTVFDPAHWEALARQTDFIPRSSSKVSGKDFVELMTTEMSEDPAVSFEGLCDVLVDLHPQAQRTPQALHQRLNPYAVTSVQEGCQWALRQHLEPVCARLPLGALSSCGRVLLADRTQCRFHAKLAEALKGSGGSASSSAVNIDLISDVMHHALWEMPLSDGTAADQGRALAIVAHLRAGDVVMRDLGSWSLESLRQIDAHEAWDLSRVSKGVAVSRDAHAEPRALALVPDLQQPDGDAAVVDLPVSLGQERVPCRLLASRLSEDVVTHRQRQAHEAARKPGRMLPQASLHWLAFGLSITKVSQQLWPSQVVGTLYRLRWHVACTCKTWQSLLHLPILKGTRPERIQGMLDGRLMTMAMIALVASYASWYAEEYLQREMRRAKLINGLTRTGRFAKALHAGTLDALCIDLWRALPTLLCTQKRRRRTSRQLIEEDGYDMEDALAASSPDDGSSSQAA